MSSRFCLNFPTLLEGIYTRCLPEAGASSSIRLFCNSDLGEWESQANDPRRLMHTQPSTLTPFLTAAHQGFLCMGLSPHCGIDNMWPDEPQLVAQVHRRAIQQSVTPCKLTCTCPLARLVLLGRLGHRVQQASRCTQTGPCSACGAAWCTSWNEKVSSYSEPCLLHNVAWFARVMRQR